MPHDPLEIANLMCSRLCHDLLSPVGAMNNGIELLTDETDEGMRAQVIELLAQSAATSANKLKFFRLAFGAAGGFGESVDSREARAAIEGLIGGEGKVALEWLVEGASLDKAAVKVLLNLALLATDALVRGGRLVIGTETRGGVTEIVVRAEGPRVLLDEESRAMLGGGGAAALSPRTVPAWLVRQLATASGGQAQVIEPESGVLLFGASLGLV